MSTSNLVDNGNSTWQVLRHETEDGKPSNRLIDNKDGTATDATTGLMWKIPAEGEGWDGSTITGNKTLFSYLEAMNITSDFAGYSDWRLPTLEELETLIIKNQSKPPLLDHSIFRIEDRKASLSSCSAIEEKTDPFPCYWTSTKEKDCWYISFETGRAFTTTMMPTLLVRLVRVAKNNIQSNKEMANNQGVVEEQGTADNNDFDCLIDNGDGTVRDTQSGLMWKIPVEGQGWDGNYATGDWRLFSQDEARKIQPQFAGYSDWRLPSLAELKSLGKLSISEASEFLRVKYRDCKSPLFWSKDLELNTKNSAWYYSFVTGSCFSAPCNNRNSVRLVRGYLNEKTNNCESEGLGFSNSVFHKLVVAPVDMNTGVVAIFPSQDLFEGNSTAAINATPADGFVFGKWIGDINEKSNPLKFKVDSDKKILAEFYPIQVQSDLPIKAIVDSVEPAKMQNGNSAFIFYLDLRNESPKQIKISIHVAKYLKANSEEIEQDIWLSGYIGSGKLATIRSGAFRKAGFVFYKERLPEISVGDQLFVTVEQDKNPGQFNYIFQCTKLDPAPEFTLINANYTTSGSDELDTSEIQQDTLLERIELLEKQLAEIQEQFAAFKETALLSPLSPAYNLSVSQYDGVLNSQGLTLPQIFDWLAAQTETPITELRRHLLPLDLLPSAFMDEINETAIDLTGEVALEEDGDLIIINQDILLQVISNRE